MIKFRISDLKLIFTPPILFIPKRSLLPLNFSFIRITFSLSKFILELPYANPTSVQIPAIVPMWFQTRSNSAQIVLICIAFFGIRIVAILSIAWQYAIELATDSSPDMRSDKSKASSMVIVSASFSIPL